MRLRPDPAIAPAVRAALTRATGSWRGPGSRVSCAARADALLNRVILHRPRGLGAGVGCRRSRLLSRPHPPQRGQTLEHTGCPRTAPISPCERNHPRRPYDDVGVTHSAPPPSAPRPPSTRLSEACRSSGKTELLELFATPLHGYIDAAPLRFCHSCHHP
jgi:hypothetical protein